MTRTTISMDSRQSSGDTTGYEVRVIFHSDWVQGVGYTDNEDCRQRARKLTEQIRLLLAAQGGMT